MVSKSVVPEGAIPIADVPAESADAVPLGAADWATTS